MSRHDISSEELAKLAETLVKAGFTNARGRPRLGTKQLVLELARRTGTSERHIRRMLKKKPDAPKDSPAHRDLRRRLERGLGTKVELNDKGGLGAIVISWHGYEQLDGLLTRLGL